MGLALAGGRKPLSNLLLTDSSLTSATGLPVLLKIYKLAASMRLDLFRV